MVIDTTRREPFAKYEAVQRLETQLRELMADYESATKLGKTDEQRFRAAFYSLHAVVRFTNDMPGWGGLNRGLLELLGALTEVDKGSTPEWLMNPSMGRNPLSESTVLVRAGCAAVMEFLMENKRSRQQAAEFILHHLPKKAIALLGVKETVQTAKEEKARWRAIDRWRDRVTGAQDLEIKDEQQNYRLTLKHLHDMPGSVDGRAEQTLRFLSKYVG